MAKNKSSKRGSSRLSESRKGLAIIYQNIKFVAHKDKMNCPGIYLFLVLRLNLEVKSRIPSRTQSPQTFWSAGRRQERLENLRKFIFFNWLLCFSSVLASIVLPQKSCGNKISVPQSLSWRPNAGQRA